MIPTGSRDTELFMEYGSRDVLIPPSRWSASGESQLSPYSLRLFRWCDGLMGKDSMVFTSKKIKLSRNVENAVELVAVFLDDKNEWRGGRREGAWNREDGN